MANLPNKDNPKYIYKNGMMGGTEKDREEFYEVLSYIRDNSISMEHKFNGCYSDFTYTLPNNESYIYRENDDYGIPTEIIYAGCQNCIYKENDVNFGSICQHKASMEGIEVEKEFYFTDEVKECDYYSYDEESAIDR